MLDVTLTAVFPDGKLMLSIGPRHTGVWFRHLSGGLSYERVPSGNPLFDAISRVRSDDLAKRGDTDPAADVQRVSAACDRA